jgi:hypothetical protein
VTYDRNTILLRFIIELTLILKFHYKSQHIVPYDVIIILQTLQRYHERGARVIVLIATFNNMLKK